MARDFWAENPDATDDWYAITWHGFDWALLEWDIERKDIVRQDPRFGEMVNDFFDHPEIFFPDVGGYISVSSKNGGNLRVYEELLGNDPSAFLCNIDDIRYVIIAGPFPDDYHAQYYIDGRLEE